MRFRVSQNVVKRYLAIAWRAIRIQHDRGNAHHIASDAAGAGDLLDGMAHHAGDTVNVERAVKLRALAQCPGEHRDGVMAAFAMPAVLDPLGIVQDVHVALVERITEGIRMGRFAPLLVRLFMALRAVSSGRKQAGWHEFAGYVLRLAGKPRILAEAIVVVLLDLVAVAGQLLVESGGLGLRASSGRFHGLRLFLPAGGSNANLYRKEQAHQCHTQDIQALLTARHQRSGHRRICQRNALWIAASVSDSAAYGNPPKGGN